MLKKLLSGEQAYNTQCLDFYYEDPRMKEQIR